MCRCSARAGVFDDASCCAAESDCVCASTCADCANGDVAEKLSRNEINVRVSVETCRESSSGGMSSPLARSCRATSALVSVDISRRSLDSLEPHAASLYPTKLNVSVAAGRVVGFGGGFGGSLHEQDTARGGFGKRGVVLTWCWRKRRILWSVEAGCWKRGRVSRLVPARTWWRRRADVSRACNQS